MERVLQEILHSPAHRGFAFLIHYKSLVDDLINLGPGGSARCVPALAVTDPPGVGGFLYSWSLGDPFLKS